MASNGKRGRGRPPMALPDRTRVVVDWRNVPVLCDIGMISCLLGMNYEFVRRQIASGKLPGVAVGKEWRVRKDVLMRYVGFLPWEIERYGYGLSVDRADRLQDEFDAGRQMMSVVG